MSGVLFDEYCSLTHPDGTASAKSLPSGLYWNVREFRSGKRKGSSPYGRLGLVLPKGGWWALLKLTPEQLEEQLSALNPAA